VNKIFLFCFVFYVIAHGYNTKEIIDNTGKKDYEYCTFYNKKYSDVLIKESLEFKAGYGPGDELRYEVPARYDRNPRAIITLGGFGGDGDFSLTPSSWGEPIKISITEGERIHNFKNGASIRYYNTPEDEIEQKYLTLFVKNMIRIIDASHSRSIDDPDAVSYMNKQVVFDILLPSLKKQELAIIRNLLFARHNYAFQTPFWRNFMNIYYPEKYNGLYSEWEVKQRFNWFEEWLLALVIEYEKKWGNAYDEFYKN
jgi:hypothetical protein